VVPLLPVPAAAEAPRLPLRHLSHHVAGEHRQQVATVVLVGLRVQQLLLVLVMHTVMLMRALAQVRARVCGARRLKVCLLESKLILSLP